MIVAFMIFNFFCVPELLLGYLALLVGVVFSFSDFLKPEFNSALSGIPQVCGFTDKTFQEGP